MFEDDPLWYKDAIIYELHVRAFYDSNNDGLGDFRGLIEKIDYLQRLGVNALWLLPFYPSPLRDDGYDIADYRNIHPDYGTMADFRQFVREAHKRGLKVITELVINHTSDQHPWFQAARRAPPKSAKRGYYVWSDSDRKFPETRIIFTDTEKSNWAWDEVAQAFYWHRFFSHQPDLNHNNPHVVKAVMRVMRYWLDAGVDGLRLDAVPYLCVREGTSNENLPETHAVIRYMRAELDRHYRNRMFLAEANQWPEDVRDYFGDGDECHMAYHFPLMPRMYMAIAQEDRHPIVEIMQQTPGIPDNCQWAIFLRNHDELTLEMVTDRERDYMYQMYVTDIRARVNVGIRRRLAPLLDNDHDKIRLMNSLLLSMPGSPIIYYGDEIGMGDNYYLGDRNGVRTPMQWSPDRNAGFSRADPQRLYQAPIMDAVYGHQAINVEAQERNPSSLLNWMRRMLAVRKSHQAFGRGTLVFLRPANRRILAYLRLYRDETILCVANLAREAQPVALDLAGYKGCVPHELLGRSVFPPIGETPYILTLPGHGFFWFKLVADGEGPEWMTEWVAQEELPLLVLFDGWRSFFRDRVVPWRIALSEQLRDRLELEVLPRFIAAQRWHEGAVRRASLLDHAEWSDAGGTWLVALLRADNAAPDALYFLPLALTWESRDEAPQLQPATALARVRQQARMGVLGDAFADPAFCRAVALAIARGEELACERGRIRFTPGTAEIGLGAAEIAELPAVPARSQDGHVTIALGQQLFLKGYRQLHAGVRPAVEIGRLLTAAGFPHVAPTLGTVEYLDRQGNPTTLCVMLGYVENQGDFWNYTLEVLRHLLEGCHAARHPVAAAEMAGQPYFILLRTLARRTAEMHIALAAAGDPGFAPEPPAPEDPAAWAGEARDIAEQALQRLASALDGLADSVRPSAGQVLAQRERIADRLQSGASSAMPGVKMRCHGDYHLRQVLINQNDFVIADMEDESPPSAWRRAKQSPLRDVASMLHSLRTAAYAAQLQAEAERPDGGGEAEALLKTWEAEAKAVFLAEYQKHAAGSGCHVPRESARVLLRIFLLAELMRELGRAVERNRDWMGLVLRDILEDLENGAEA